MPKEFNPEEQMFLEFDFKINIKSTQKNDFFYIKEKISQIDYRYYSKNNNSIRRESELSNIPYFILKSQFDKHFRFLGQGKAYLTNYIENHGSFEMDFTILIIQSAFAYGGIRETIDYFVDDLEHLFKGSLPNDFKTKISYSEKRKIKKKDKAIVHQLNSIIKSLERNIFINRIIIGIILFFLILGITYITNIYDEDNFVTKEEYELKIKDHQNRPLKDTKIEVYINEKVNDSIK